MLVSRDLSLTVIAVQLSSASGNRPICTTRSMQLAPLKRMVHQIGYIKESPPWYRYTNYMGCLTQPTILGTES